MTAEEAKSDPRIVLDLARNRLQNQLAFGDTLDTKLANLFAAGSALVGLLAAVLALEAAERGWLEVVIFLIGIGVYGALSSLWWIAGKPVIWEVGPNVEAAWKKSLEVSEDVLVPQLIESYQTNWQNNEKKTEEKVNALRRAFYLVLMQTGCLLAAAAVAIVD